MKKSDWNFFSKNHTYFSFVVSSFIFFVIFFSTNLHGQIALPFSQLNPEFDTFSNYISSIGILKNQLFFTTRDHLWTGTLEGKNIHKIEGFFQPSIFQVENTDDFLLLSASNSPDSDDYKSDLFIIKGDSQIIKIAEKTEFIRIAKFFNGKLFVGESEGTFIFDTTNISSYKNIINEGDVSNLKLIQDNVFVQTHSHNLIIFDQNTQQMEYFNGHIEEDEVVRPLYDIESFNGNLFFCNSNKLQVIDNDLKNSRVIDSFDESVNAIEAYNEQLFIGTDDGLFILDKDNQISKVEKISEGINSLRKVNDLLLTDDLIIKKNEGRLDILENENFYFYDEMSSNVASDQYLYSVRQEEAFTSTYRIDLNIKIGSKLVSNNWWTKAINSFLPSNWLTAEKVQSNAFYLDATSKDPYDESFPREFRFAKADGEKMPSEDKFSTSEQFDYEINWGKNEVHYWVKDKWGNTFEQKAIYYGLPSQYFVVMLPFLFSAFLILGCFVLAPKVGFAHSAIMNPWLRKYFSLGSVPLLISVFPSLRRYILHRYATAVGHDKEFNEWKTRFVSPDEDFLPESFGKKLNDERRLLLTGQSGIGKTVFFKYLTAYYVSENKPPLPAKVFPVYISLTNYGGNSLEELVYNQLFAYGKITDKELAPMFLEQGGLLIFFDGVNEVQNVADRQKLSEFVEKYWTSNYICLSSQQSYPEIDNIPKVELKSFSKEKVDEFIKQRADDKEKAEKVIENLTDEDYQLYSVPRDLEFAVAIVNDGKDSLPKSRTELYKSVFSSIFAKWQEKGNTDAENILCEHAYAMMAERDLAFDTVDNPKYKEITSDLFEQKFLIKREKNYNFRHDLIRAYLASEYFYPNWQNLFADLKGKQIDSNWLEMLKFSCENIENENEVKSLVYEVMEKSIRKDLVKKLFEWLKTNQPDKCKAWEKVFYAKYGELDFKN